MKTFLRIILALVVAVVLTVVTQVGALVVLLWWPLGRTLKKRLVGNRASVWLRTAAFLGWWTMFSLLIIPQLAPLGGRVALPLWGNAQLKPFHIGYALLNRHYARPALRTLLLESAEQLNQQYPGTVVAYLDACFPFGNGWPLLPHLSHNDGRKVDVAFQFQNVETQAYLPRKALSIIAYGGCVVPRPGERDQAAICQQNGHKQYSFLYQLLPQIRSRRLAEERTREMIRQFSRHPNCGKLLLEPHLKSRLKLNYDNIRFQGCHAVRHDDHVHVQL